MAGAVAVQYTVNGLLAFPTSAASLSADATKVAYSVNEVTSASNSTRVDRVYVYDLTTGAPLTVLTGAENPVFVDTGELLVRAGNVLHVLDAQFHDQGALPIVVEPRYGAYSASPDGRHIAYENGSRVDGYDRTTGATWHITNLAPRSVGSPVFSPDGQWLALLREGVVALTYAHIIPFTPGLTYVIDDSSEVRSPEGQSYYGLNRIGWST
jgi:Tol biopolymer transport system component